MEKGSAQNARSGTRVFKTRVPNTKPYRRNMLSHLTTIYQSSDKYEPRIKHLFTICHSIFRETLQDIPMWRFPKSWGYPQIIHFSRIFHYKPSILGYPHLWKSPLVWSVSKTVRATRFSSSCSRRGISVKQRAKGCCSSSSNGIGPMPCEMNLGHVGHVGSAHTMRTGGHRSKQN